MDLVLDGVGNEYLARTVGGYVLADVEVAAAHLVGRHLHRGVGRILETKEDTQ